VVEPAHIVLIGLMASGKTTIGTALAARLHYPFIDNDEALTARFGHTAREIETSTGSDILHRDEADVLRRALADPQPAVIAAAAGAVPEPDVGDALRGQTVVYLRASPAELSRRIETMPDDGHRPFGARSPADVLQAQFNARDPIYRALATLVVETEAASVADIVEIIAGAVGG
jgi:shikimate kinase